MRSSLLALLAIVLATPIWAQSKPNVLFIAVDDLRPQLACYGRQQMHTPNFDELAKRGVLFERAYCMVPTCGASRASLMTSLRPHPKRFVTYTARADEEAPDAITLNTLLKQNGYTTISLGKVFHFPDDNKHGWSEKPWRPKTSDYQNTAAMKQAIAAHKAKYPKRTKVRGPAYESADAPDESYRDYQTASQAIEYLDRFADDNGKPFFLAVGFFKPHLPFCAPKKYWDKYDFAEIDLPDNYRPPQDVPKGAVHTSGELRAYSGIPPSGPVDRETARHLIHGYYACVSFIDAQLGRLLGTLDETGLAENTIIVLWGDHGWQLGEHGMWNKHSCFETSMHTPLFVAAPGIAPARVSALTEFIDIYPSLCELTGIRYPDHVQGTSFVRLMKDPSLPGKPGAVGRYRSGDTVRSDRFRYSEYRDKNGAGRRSGRMLYDHSTDPDENNNVVDAQQHASVVKILAENLDAIKGKLSRKK